MIFLQIEQSIWTDFIAKQAPIIIFLLGGLYFGLKYFVKQQDKKDAIIAEKDKKLEDQNNRVMELYAKAIESQNRGNLVQEQLLGVLKETKEEINKLHDKVK